MSTFSQTNGTSFDIQPAHMQCSTGAFFLFFGGLFAAFPWYYSSLMIWEFHGIFKSRMKHLDVGFVEPEPILFESWLCSRPLKKTPSKYKCFKQKTNAPNAPH